MNALITGATRGTGKAIALKLASKGFNIIALAKSKDNLSTLRQEITAKFPVTVTCISIDFNDVDSTEKEIKKLSQNIDDMNVIVNNVGAFGMESIEDLSVAQLDTYFNINLKTAFLISKYFSKTLKSQNKGHIFNIGSIVSEIPRTDCAGYTLSKFALNGLSKMLIEGFKEYKIKVTEIIPGSINSSSWDGIDAPKHEFIQTEDIAESIWSVLQLSKAANVEQIIIRPLNKDF